MSDSQSQSYSPTQKAGKKTSPVLIWLLVVALAGGAFAAAVMYVGGFGAVMDMLGVGGGAQPPASSAASATTTSSVSPTATPPAQAEGTLAPGVPVEAQRRMYGEQIESQEMITELAAGTIASLDVGTPKVDGDKAVVPVTANLDDGSTVDGTLVLRRYNGVWYFFSITRFEKDPETANLPDDYNKDVVAVITSEQAKPDMQEMITDGLLGGGYTTVVVKDTTQGAGTSAVNVTLTGGTEADSAGRFILIQEDQGGVPYWFITGFEKQ